jgi:hypothetical protein
MDYRDVPIDDCGIKGVDKIWVEGVLVYDVSPQRPDESDLDYQARITRSKEYGQS